jgi:uncharacterized protein
MNERRIMRAIAWFLVLTFGSVWALWSPLYLSGVQKVPGLAVMLMAVGMWGPGLAAIVAVKLILRESLRTTTIGRLGRVRYYAWAWLIPVVGTLAAMGLTVLFGIARFDPEFTWLRSQIAASGAQVPLPTGVIVLIQTIAALTIAPLINCLFALGEELGWRGFLLPRLIEAGWGQWRALVLTGAIWGLWHAPVILLGHNYPDHPKLGVLLMTVFCILLGIIFGWLQLASRSVWTPTLAHATLNAVAGFPLIVLTPYDTALGGMMTSVVGWIPLVLFILWLAWSARLPVPIHSDEGSHETAQVIPASH